MRKTVLSVCVLAFAAALVLPAPALAAHHSSHKSQVSSSHSSSAGKGGARAASPAPSKDKTRSSKTTGARKSARSSRRDRSADEAAPTSRRDAAGSRAKSDAADSKRCSSRRVKRGRHSRTVRSCGGEAAEPALVKSPIQNKDLDATPADGKDATESKARVAPERAYAVDGETFFFQGRKFRIEGLKGVDNSEMAKQRLQKELDGGTLSVEPVGADEAGGASAVVRVNGRNIADTLSSQP